MARQHLVRGAGMIALVMVAATVTSCTGGESAESASPYAGVAGLPEAAVEAMEKPAYEHGHWGIWAADLDTGEVLIDLDGNKMVEPGSVIKTYAMGAAWLEWGPDRRITTPVKRDGEVVAGTLQGDLILVGQGDFTMGGRTNPDGTVDFANLDHNDANALPGSTLTSGDPLAGLDDLAAQVKAAGIDAVSGQVVVDDRLFLDFDGDLPITPIVINQNVIDIMITPGEAGEPATIEMTPEVAPWTVTNEVETVAAGEPNDLSNPESPQHGEIVVSGTIAADSDPQLKVYGFEDPATFARTAFIEALQRAGVAVGADPLAENPDDSLADQDAVMALPSVAELESLPLEEDATYVLKVSYNRGAQMYTCLLAVEVGGDDCSDGLTEAASLWGDAGLTLTDASLIDGSGIAGNFATPHNIAQLQTIMAERDDAERWKATLPVLGVDGSLTDVEKDSPSAGKVFAKTGTIAGGDFFNGRVRLGAKALGGVMESESGRNLAFAIVVSQGFFADPSGVLDANADVGAVAAAIQQHY